MSKLRFSCWRHDKTETDDCYENHIAFYRKGLDTCLRRCDMVCVVRTTGGAWRGSAGLVENRTTTVIASERSERGNLKVAV